MLKKHKLHTAVITGLICLCVVLTACESIQTPTQIPATHTAPLEVEVLTDTPAPTPSATSIPTAALVNGEVIPLSYYENELLRYQDALAAYPGSTEERDPQTEVLDYLVEQALLAQAARAAGFEVSDEMLQARIDELVSELGSGGALTTWMESNHYDDAEFRTALRLSIEAAWQRDQVIAAIPEAVEQVRARQIFAKTEAGAQRALANLEAGGDFDALAWEYSPESGGELGWFPRGYLLYPEVEEAAFSMQVGERSGIIQSELGYHILLIIGHEEVHPLTTDARVALQSQALRDWLETRRLESEIVVTLP